MFPNLRLRSVSSAGLLLSAAVLAACSGGGGSGAGAGSGGSDTPPADSAQQRILFVGNSFTHGRYAPVRQYNSGGKQAQAGGSALVIDENAGQTGARAEDDEKGPFGGIPGLFAEFAAEAGLNYDVHIEAISSATLQGHYNAALSVIADSKWNTVVLQEQSTRPLPSALAGSASSNPAAFCSAVRSLEQALHAVAPTSAVYLYQTWPRADSAQELAGDPAAAGFATKYANALAQQGDAFHDAYYRAAALDGKVAGVAPVGDAWVRAWEKGYANLNPYAGASSLPSLWYGRNAVNDPVISAPDYYHPSVYGAYLSALVLFQKITGVDVRSFGADEDAAAALGIPATATTRLQQVAWEAVTQEDSSLRSPGADACATR
jgi:hypothetical protein